MTSRDENALSRWLKKTNKIDKKKLKIDKTWQTKKIKNVAQKPTNKKRYKYKKYYTRVKKMFITYYIIIITNNRGESRTRRWKIKKNTKRVWISESSIYSISIY